jgi:hypothetical protein
MNPMPGITLKRSLSTLAVIGGVLAAAGPASAGTAVGNPGDRPALRTDPTATGFFVEELQDIYVVPRSGSGAPAPSFTPPIGTDKGS